MPAPPNVLFVMTDQQRFDTIAALGYPHVHTPNMDRLVERGVACTNAYPSAPVCIPARYGIRTGREPPSTGYWGNDKSPASDLEETTGPFLARAMRERGYRTFGVGKFHAHPAGIDLGYDERLTGDDYVADTGVDPSLDVGRTGAMNMQAQTSPLSTDDRRMRWIADRAVERIERTGDDPFFGLVSFEKPHPGWNPSPPFDECYDPDAVPDPIRENRAVDHADEKMPAQNYHFWKSRRDDTDPETTRTVRSHYYGLVTQLDREVGRVLDAVEARDDAANTLICFYSDHGELLGDHHGWGKTAFFEQSARVPFLLSWPAELAGEERFDGLASLTDLFGVATRAAGDPEFRDGADLLGAIRGETSPRERLYAYHETPRKTDAFAIPPNFTMMVREGSWKYVYAALGGRELLFDLDADPRETVDRSEDELDVTNRLRGAAVDRLREGGAHQYLEGDDLVEYPYRRIEMGRYNADGYPDSVGDAVDDFADDLS